jgi:hypothetical protein
LRVRSIETAQQGCENEIIFHKQSKRTVLIAY